LHPQPRVYVEKTRELSPPVTGNTRHFLAMVLTAYSALSPWTGCLHRRACAVHGPIRDFIRLPTMTPGVGAFRTTRFARPGGGFKKKEPGASFRSAPRHRIPPRVRDDPPEAALKWDGTGGGKK